MKKFVALLLAAVMLLALTAWFVLGRTVAGYAVRVVGRAPAAARHGGFDANRITWAALLASGGLAGLALGSAALRAV